MDAIEPAPPAPEYSRRAPPSVPRRSPGDRVLLRPSRWSETARAARSWTCADCGEIISWQAVNHTHGLPLCQSCARKRRTDPPPEDNMELAARLTLCQMAMKQELMTTMELLKGTAFEEESREWANLIARSLEGTGIGSTPARSMNHTIARLREPFIHGGSAW